TDEMYNSVRDLKKQQQLVDFRTELNTLRQFSGAYFHALEYKSSDVLSKHKDSITSWKKFIIRHYKYIDRQVRNTYKDNKQIQTFWKCLHGNDMDDESMKIIAIYDNTIDKKYNDIDEKYKWSERDRTRAGIYLQYEYDDRVKILCPYKGPWNL